MFLLLVKQSSRGREKNDLRVKLGVSVRAKAYEGVAFMLKKF